MCDNHDINFSGVNRQFVPVAQPQFLLTLKEAAINEYLLVVGFDQIFGTGHATRSAQKSEGNIHKANLKMSRLEASKAATSIQTQNSDKVLAFQIGLNMLELIFDLYD